MRGVPAELCAIPHFVRLLNIKSLRGIRRGAYDARCSFNHEDPSTKAVTLSAQWMTNDLPQSHSGRPFDANAVAARLRAETRGVKMGR